MAVIESSILVDAPLASVRAAVTEPSLVGQFTDGLATLATTAEILAVGVPLNGVLLLDAEAIRWEGVVAELTDERFGYHSTVSPVPIACEIVVRPEGPQTSVRFLLETGQVGGFRGSHRERRTVRVMQDIAEQYVRGVKAHVERSLVPHEIDLTESPAAMS